MSGDNDEDGDIAKYYSPVSRMSEKAAMLRQEIAEIEGKDKDAKPNPGRLSVRIDLAGNPGPALSRPTTASGFAARSSLSGGLATRPSTAGGLHSKSSSMKSTRRRSGGGGGGGGGDLMTRQSGVSQSSEEGGGRAASVANRSSSPVKGQGVNPQHHLALQESHRDAQLKAQSLENDVAGMKLRQRELNQELEQRQGSYMRREEVLQAQVDKLSKELSRLNGERPMNEVPLFGKSTKLIKELHTQMDAEIEALLDRQAVLFKQEEHTTMKKFKERLNDAEAEVSEYRTSSGRTHDEWSKRTLGMRVEMEEAQSLALKFDQMYKLSNEECCRLRAQFKAQEEDREQLIRHVVGLKGENKRLFLELGRMASDLKKLSAERQELQDEKSEIQQQLEAHAVANDYESRSDLSDSEETLGKLPEASGGGGADGEAGTGARASPSRKAAPAGRTASQPVAGAPDSKRYEEVLSSMRKVLEAEKLRTRQARAAHTAELQQRTELQSLLRQCVDDLRERRQAAIASTGSTGGVNSCAYSGRPRSAYPSQAEASTSAPSAVQHTGRPLSAYPGNRTSVGPAYGGHTTSGGGLSSSTKLRPGSAYLPNQRRSTGARPMSATPSGGGGEAEMLATAEREELVKELLAKEEVMKLVFDKAFPGMAPHPPGDPYIDRMANFMEARDQQVVNNARYLGYMKQNTGRTGAGLEKGTTPGGPLAKDAATKPWVLNVDAMLSDFLQARPAGAGDGPVQMGRASGAPSASQGALDRR